MPGERNDRHRQQESFLSVRNYLLRKRFELIEVERLRAVGERVLRVGMNFDHDAVRADGSGGAGEGSDQFAAASGVAWIDNHRKVRPFAQDRDRGKIERVAGGRSE